MMALLALAFSLGATVEAEGCAAVASAAASDAENPAAAASPLATLVTWKSASRCAASNAPKERMRRLPEVISAN